MLDGSEKIFYTFDLYSALMHMPCDCGMSAGESARAEIKFCFFFDAGTRHLSNDKKTIKPIQNPAGWGGIGYKFQVGPIHFFFPNAYDINSSNQTTKYQGNTAHILVC